MPAAINRTGKRFGKITVLSKADNGWLCKCDCGKTKVIKRPERIKSCGCNIFTHGLTHHPFYSVWAVMKRRCYDINFHKYKDYGARGIKVCKEWHDAKNFIDWCLLTNPNKEPGLTLDRRNNDGDYSPDNCRWSTAKQQNRNRRGVKMDMDDVEALKMFANMEVNSYLSKSAIGRIFAPSYGMHYKSIASNISNKRR